MKQIIVCLMCLFGVYLTARALAQNPIRVKCGGNNYTDSKGHVWSADYGYNNGTVSSSTTATSGTTDPKLFQSGWNSAAATPLVYTFPVAGSTYHANL